MFLYDAADLEDAVLAVLVWALQGKGAAFAAEDTLFAGVNAASRARNHYHLLVKGFNHLLTAGLRKHFGLACNNPDKLEVLILELLREIDPTLPDGAVELIRNDAAREEGASKKPVKHAQGSTVGGKGYRAWNVVAGMRVFCGKAGSKALETALVNLLDPEGHDFIVFPNQPHQLAPGHVGKERGEGMEGCEGAGS